MVCDYENTFYIIIFQWELNVFGGVVIKLFILTFKGQKGLVYSVMCKCKRLKGILVSCCVMTLLKDLCAWKIRPFCV
jgi:hypothetical protein